MAPPPSPQKVVHWLMQQAEAGDDAAGALRLQLLRLAGAYVVESCDGGEAGLCFLNALRGGPLVRGPLPRGPLPRGPPPRGLLPMPP